jgi:hypothetical protein
MSYVGYMSYKGYMGWVGYMSSGDDMGRWTVTGGAEATRKPIYLTV